MKWDWSSDIYLHREVVDFRKSINGLVMIVEQEMALSPFSGALFVFCNRSRDKLKIVYWDQTGFCLWYKRLEKNKFYWPKQLDMDVITWNQEQLDWLLRGLNVIKMTSHKPLIYSDING